MMGLQTKPPIQQARLITAVSSQLGSWKLTTSPGTRPRVASTAAIFLALVTRLRSEEHTSELQSLMRISYAVFCLKKKTVYTKTHTICNRRHDNNDAQT